MLGSYLVIKDGPMVTSEWQVWFLIGLVIVGVFMIVVALLKR